MSFADFDIEKIITVVQKTGELVVEMRRAGLQNVRGKATAIDLVTEADVASEALLRSELHRLYPAVGFWGEESNQQPNEDYFWLVDPIDGTVNYANGVPHYSITVALNKVADDQHPTTLLGVTLQLPFGDIYWAIQGRGAFLRAASGREQRLTVNQVTQLDRALLITGFPYHRAEAEDNNGREFAYFLQHSQGVRTMGSAALDLAFVASGAMAAYWEGWLKPWDAATGALLVREAGGAVTDYNGASWTLTSGSLVASNGQPALQQALLEGIRVARAGLPESRLRTT